MTRFLSADWLAALADAARHQPGDGADPPLTVEQLVTGAPGGDVAYHVTVDDQGVTVAPGSAASATVRFRQDYTTAREIARGTVSAQAAFMAGRIRVTGDLTRLVESQAALARIDAVFRAVRDRTDYEDARA